MILQLAPDAPLIVRAAAATALILHIGGGATAIGAGWTSIVAKKGGRLHRVAGTVFFVAMLSMAGVGAIVAPMLPEAQWTNTSAAIFTLYLVASSWATVRRPAGEIGRFEQAALAVPLGLITVAILLALASPDRGSGDFIVVYVLAVIASIAGLADLRMIRAGGIFGPARVARHLWRMTLGLFVATGSFFMGQPKFVPEIMKDTGLNIIVSLAVLVLMAFWMVRVRAPRLFRRRLPATA
jgi:uncharacterized membrane protein